MFALWEYKEDNWWSISFLKLVKYLMALTLDLSFPEIKCLPQTRPWSKMLAVRSSQLMAEILCVLPFLGKISHFFVLLSCNWRYSCYINSFIIYSLGSTAKNSTQNHCFLSSCDMCLLVYQCTNMVANCIVITWLKTIYWRHDDFRYSPLLLSSSVVSFSYVSFVWAV